MSLCSGKSSIFIPSIARWLCSASFIRHLHPYNIEPDQRCVHDTGYVQVGGVVCRGLCLQGSPEYFYVINVYQLHVHVKCLLQQSNDGLKLVWIAFF